MTMNKTKRLKRSYWKSNFLIWTFFSLLSVNTVAQNTVSLSLENVSLTELFKAIEQKSNVRFSYLNQDIDTQKDITISTKNEDIESVLQKVLQKKGYSYQRTGNTIAILKIASKPTKTLKKITGLVTDEKGDPIIGATIKVIGSSAGTVTDINGKYQLLNASNSRLTFSYVGYQSTTIDANGREIINVKLAENAKALDEVVVIGYGTLKKKDLTGSSTSLKSEAFEKSPAISMEQAMQGRLAGVLVSSSSGEPGAGINITVRGASSISGGNQPLYVIDGVPIFNNSSDLAREFENNDGGQTQLNLMSSINPNDIESIEVLKDASATAIYGSRGANGVIMITTKRGKIGKGTIDIDYKTSYSLIPDQVPLVNAKEYATFVNESRLNTGYTPIYDGRYHPTVSGKDSIYFPTPDEIPGLMGNGTNWQREIMRNAKSNDLLKNRKANLWKLRQDYWKQSLSELKPTAKRPMSCQNSGSLRRSLKFFLPWCPGCALSSFFCCLSLF